MSTVEKRWDTVEFQVVILAGGSGSKLGTLTEAIPKALLPIANRPLLSYQIETLEKAGFKEVIILTNEEAKSQIVKFASDLQTKVKCDIVAIRDEMGTAEALRAIKSRIKTDFFVISSDLITTASLHNIADVHRINDSAVTVLLKTIQKEASSKSKKESAPEYFGLDSTGKRLILKASGADLEESLSVRKKWLRRFPEITIRTDLLDAHCYLFSHWVLELIDARVSKNISSLRADLIPYLIKRQFSEPEVLTEHGFPDNAGKRLFQEAFEYSSSSYDPTDRIRVCAYLAKPTDYVARANTMASYMEMNREIGRGAIPSYLPTEPEKEGSFIHPSVTYGVKPQVGNECVIGENTRTGDKVMIKKSIIGRGCSVGNNVKLSNCIIMDRVQIGNDVTLNNSLICNDCVIKDGVTFVSVTLGVGSIVKEKSELKNDQFSKADLE